MPAKFLCNMGGALVAPKRQTGGPARRSRGALRACPAPWCFAQPSQKGSKPSFASDHETVFKAVGIAYL